MAEEVKSQEKANQEEKSHQKPNKTLVIVLSLLAGLVVVFGVGSTLFRASSKKVAVESVEKAMEQASQGNAEVDLDLNDGEGKISVETEEGEFTAGIQKLPDDFPNDLPVYQDADILSTSTSRSDSLVVLSTSDPFDSVVSFYQRELERNGWSIETTAQIANATVLSIEKGSSTGGVIINETDEGVQITLEVSLNSQE